MRASDQQHLEYQAFVMNQVWPEISLDVFYALLVIHNSPSSSERAKAEIALMKHVAPITDRL